MNWVHYNHYQGHVKAMGAHALILDGVTVARVQTTRNWRGAAREWRLEVGEIVGGISSVHNVYVGSFGTVGEAKARAEEMVKDLIEQRAAQQVEAALMRGHR